MAPLADPGLELPTKADLGIEEATPVAAPTPKNEYDLSALNDLKLPSLEELLKPEVRKPFKLSKPPPVEPYISTPVVPKEKPITPLGFLENTLEQGKDMLTGIVTSVQEGYKTLFKMKSSDWAYLVKNPMAITDGVWDVTKNIVRTMVGDQSDYAKHGLRVFYDKPLTPVLDALTLVSLGGAGLTKAGQLGKVAGVIDAVKADAMIAKGAQISALPARLGEWVFDLPLKAVGIDTEARRALIRNSRDKRAGAQALKGHLAPEVNANVPSKMADADKVALDKMLMEGTTPNELIANPVAAKARSFYRDNFLKALREKTLAARDLLSEADMDTAVAKKYASRKYGSSTGETLEKARADILALPEDMRPVYTPAVFDKEHSLADIFYAPDVIKKGKVGFLEPFRGGKGKINDPTIYIRKAIDAFIDAEAEFQFLDELVKTPGMVTPIAKGAGRELSDLVGGGIYKKYIDKEARAQGVAVAAKREELGVQAGTSALAKDPVVGKYINTINDLAVKNDTVGRYLRMTFSRQSGPWGQFLRVYDNILGKLKAGFTVFNPHWYSGNVVGDGLLSVLAGDYGLNMKVVREVLNAFPSEMKPHLRSIAREAGGGAITTSFAEIAQGADDLVRRGIWTRRVADQLKAMVSSGTLTHEKLIEGLRKVGESPRQLVELYAKIQKVDEDIARNTPLIHEIRAKVIKETANRDAMIAKYGETEKRVVDLLHEGEQASAAERAVKIGATDKAVGDRLVTLLDQYDAVNARVDALKKKRYEQGNKMFKAKEYEALDLGEQTREIQALRGKASNVLGQMQALVLSDEMTSAVARYVAPNKGLTAFMERLKNGIEYSEGEISLLRSQQASSIAEVREGMRKAGELDKLIPELRQYTDISRTAVEQANYFLGDYNGGGPIERGVLRRVVPFYPWMKAMGQLAFRLPFIAPKSTFFWHNYAKTLLSMAGDESMPEWARPYIPVFVRENGDTVWLRITNLMPFSAGGTTRIFGIKIPKLIAFWESNPFIALGLKGIGARTEFYWAGKPKPGELMVSVGDGKVTRFTEDGQLETVVPQTPITEAVSNLFPWVQMLNQLTSPYDVNKGASLNPDGTYHYPKEFWQSVVESVGPKTRIQNANQIVQQEASRAQRTIKNLRKLMRYADPDDKEHIQNVIQDYARGEYRKFKAS